MRALRVDRRATLGIFVLATGLAIAAGAGPRDPLQVWTDADGVVRYTTHEERIGPGGRDSAQPVVAADPRASEDRIAELQTRIAADEAALAAYLSEDGGPADRDALEAIAERLPRLQEQLRALLEQRGASRPADAP